VRKGGPLGSAIGGSLLNGARRLCGKGITSCHAGSTFQEKEVSSRDLVLEKFKFFGQRKAVGEALKDRSEEPPRWLGGNIPVPMGGAPTKLKEVVPKK